MTEKRFDSDATMDETPFRGDVRASVQKWSDANESHRADWILELVKNLALLNGVGVTGVAAMAAAGKTFPDQPFFAIACSFSAGLFFALLDLYLTALGYSTVVALTLRQLQQFDKTNPPTQASARELFSGLRATNWWMRFGAASGATSAVCLTIGLFAFVLLVMARPSEQLPRLPSADLPPTLALLPRIAFPSSPNGAELEPSSARLAMRETSKVSVDHIHASPENEAQSSVAPQTEVKGSFALEVLKVLIGTVSGALIGYFVTLRIQSVTIRSQNIAAGNLAMATLVSQYDDFLNLRRHVLAGIRDVRRAEFPGAPPWALYSPVPFNFSESNRFDFGLLTFLFKKGHQEAFQPLVVAQKRYFDLGLMLKSANECALAIQRAVASLGVSANSVQSHIEVEAQLPPDLVGQANSLAQAVFVRLERDGKDYLHALATLRSALVEKFGEEPIVGSIPDPAFDYPPTSANPRGGPAT